MSAKDHRPGRLDEAELQVDRLVEGMKLHEAGVNGDKEAVVQAHSLFEQLHEQDPGDPLIRAYYGSAKSLLGRDVIDPMERFAYTLKGIKILDAAVREAPDNIQIRILRAYLSFRIPELYFHRTAAAVEDFKYLAVKFEQDGSVFTPAFYRQILYDLAAAYERLGRLEDAQVTRRKIAELADDPRFKALFAPPDKGKISAGQELHRRALEGDQEALKTALDFFGQAHRDDPEDSLIAAYYADCLSAVGRDAADPGTMFANPYRAMRMIDDAVNKSPDDLRVRLLRAAHSLRLPEAFFHRTATAIIDLEFLLQRYHEDPKALPEPTCWQLLLDLATAYERLGMTREARDTDRRLSSLRLDDRYQALLRERESRRADLSAPDPASLSTKEALMKEGMRLHGLAAGGNTMAAKPASELFQKALEIDPEDPLVMAYCGSSMALVARDAMDPRSLFTNTTGGLRLLDQAKKRDPDNPRIRLLAAYAAYLMPESFFHQTRNAIEDFTFVAAACERDQKILSTADYHKVLYHLGLAYQRLNDQESARKAWAKLLAGKADSRYKDLVRARAKEVRS